jgi:hypothetical protein
VQKTGRYFGLISLRVSMMTLREAAPAVRFLFAVEWALIKLPATTRDPEIQQPDTPDIVIITGLSGSGMSSAVNV